MHFAIGQATVNALGKGKSKKGKEQRPIDSSLRINGNDSKKESRKGFPQSTHPPKKKKKASSRSHGTYDKRRK